MEWFDGRETAATIPQLSVDADHVVHESKDLQWGNQDWALQCLVSGWAPREWGVLQKSVFPTSLEKVYLTGFVWVGVFSV